LGCANTKIRQFYNQGWEEKDQSNFLNYKMKKALIFEKQFTSWEGKKVKRKQKKMKRGFTRKTEYNIVVGVFFFIVFGLSTL